MQPKTGLGFNLMKANGSLNDGTETESRFCPFSFAGAYCDNTNILLCKQFATLEKVSIDIWEEVICRDCCDLFGPF